ncbi:TM2 domain-containing protein [Dysgonomonas sp. 25]|uniref:TM2 domain-containing protein n=1 Tax=Dysgonomonas sp. 25 TaxID=2302933 RepID=UPI0013D6E926|nr:TM2 domain-containing protein [Dysgonomonas sp. 25]NDV67658.1 TM2 domain-containing protein [Dysgonomonas sp. 25]
MSEKEKKVEKEVQEVAENVSEVVEKVEQEATETKHSAEDKVNEVSEKLAPKNVKPQSKITMIFVCWFLGFFGVHRYMMGYSNWWLMPITLGGCFIWILLDFIKIITGKMTMADGTPLE